MQFSVSTSDSKKIEECIIYLTGQEPGSDSPTKFSELAKQYRAQGDFNGDKGSHLILHNPEGFQARRVVLFGTGKEELTGFKGYQLLSKLAELITNLPVKQATVIGLPPLCADLEQASLLMAQCFVEASYRFNQFKSDAKKPTKLTKVNIKADKKSASSIRNGLSRGAALGEGVNLARNLGDLPGNVCTPGYLAAQAKALAKTHTSVTTQVLNEAQCRDLGMGSLLSVTAGTVEPAKLIIVKYKGGKATDKPVVLVGKGVTFDSGGISLKPGAAMDEMKYDMCGAASVLGAIKTLAISEPAINVVGIIPAVENMPSGKATKPGDIVTSMSGQTIEVLNTDAEGRLILCDALTYAARFKPACIIDIATLTGACIVALGSHANGLFANDDQLAAELLNSGIRSGDRAWQMPLWEEYDKQLKSNFADIANIGGPKAGSVTAACFLSRFTREQRWAHLDIAGTAWNSGAKKGATGRPVPLLVDFILNRVAQ